MKKKLLLLMVTVFVTCITYAQNFSGRYIIQSREILDGIEYLNAIAQEITVVQSKDSITITRIAPAGDGKTTTSFITLSLSGKEQVATRSGRKIISSISLDKANKMATIKTIFMYSGNPEEAEFTNIEKWTLSDVGVLTITKTSDAAVTDDWTLKAIFKKQ